MKRYEYLLTCLGEEACEVAAEVLNIPLICLNLKDVDPLEGPQSYAVDWDYEPFIQEVVDFNTCVQILFDERILPELIDAEKIIQSNYEGISSVPFVDMRGFARQALLIQYRVSKLLRFGLGHTRPHEKVTGVNKLLYEIYNMKAWMRFISEKMTFINFNNPQAQAQKKFKVYKYLQHSIDEGIVQLDSTSLQVVA